MSILFRYVLRSFAVPAMLCLTGLCALTLLFMSFDLIAACFNPEAHVTLLSAADFLGGTLSAYLEWLLPAVFLLATLYTMWQFCRHSELIAMRASGIGMGTIVAPILLTAFLAAGLSFANTEFLKPTAAARARAIKDSDFRESGREPLKGIGYAAPNGARIWSIGEMDLARPELLRNVRVTLFRPDGSKRLSHEAPVARWLDGAWWLQGDAQKPVHTLFYDELDTVEKAPEGYPVDVAARPLYEASETPAQIRAQNVKIEFASAADRRQNRKNLDQTGLSRRQKNDDSYATYNHYAAPVAILIVTLFAIPAGIASGRQSVFRGIMLAISLFLAYYAVTALAMLLSNHDLLKPAAAVAMPSVVFGVAAAALFRKLR